MAKNNKYYSYLPWPCEHRILAWHLQVSGCPCVAPACNLTTRHRMHYYLASCWAYSSYSQHQKRTSESSCLLPFFCYGWTSGSSILLPFQTSSFDYIKQARPFKACGVLESVLIENVSEPSYKRWLIFLENSPVQNMGWLHWNFIRYSDNLFC